MLLGGCWLWVVGCGLWGVFRAVRGVEIQCNQTWISGWKPIPSEARVTRDEVSGIKQYPNGCLEDSTETY